MAAAARRAGRSGRNPKCGAGALLVACSGRTSWSRAGSTRGRAGRFDRRSGGPLVNPDAPRCDDRCDGAGHHHPLRPGRQGPRAGRQRARPAGPQLPQPASPRRRRPHPPHPRRPSDRRSASAAGRGPGPVGHGGGRRGRQRPGRPAGRSPRTRQAVRRARAGRRGAPARSRGGWRDAPRPSGEDRVVHRCGARQAALEGCRAGASTRSAGERGGSGQAAGPARRHIRQRAPTSPSSRRSPRRSSCACSTTTRRSGSSSRSGPRSASTPTFRTSGRASTTATGSTRRGIRPAACAATPPSSCSTRTPRPSTGRCDGIRRSTPTGPTIR